MDADVLNPAPNLPAQAARPVQTKRVVKFLSGIKSDAALNKRVKEGKLPQPVVINGIRYWYADEVAACINNQPRGQGYKPVAALAARARQVAQARAAKAGKPDAVAPAKSSPDRNSNGHFIGPTARSGFVRRATTT